MKPAAFPRRQRGFTLVELMVALTIGLVMIGAIIAVYIAQSSVYRSSNSQASLQAAENAISALVVPTIRTAAFGGCAALGSRAISVVAAGLPAPLNSFPTPTTAIGGNTASATVQGYDYSGTNGSGTSLAIATLNGANDGDASHWSPALDAGLAGQVLTGSDVLVVAGPLPGVAPIGVTVATTGTSVTVADATALPTGRLAAISDCSKSAIFQVTSVTGQALGIAATGASPGNVTGGLSFNFNEGAQVVPLTQTAFFVGHTATGQSALMRARLDGSTGTSWSDPELLIPGVETMQLLYGIANGGCLNATTFQYVAASAVSDWTGICSVRMAFLIEGEPGSAKAGAAPAPALLGTTVTPPADTRLRRTYELTVDLRNNAT